MPTVARMTDGGLVAAGDLDATFANVGGSARTRRQYIADAAALAERLPKAGAMLNLSVDRYRFAVGLGAALLRGHTSLLPQLPRVPITRLKKTELLSFGFRLRRASQNRR